MQLAARYKFKVVQMVLLPYGRHLYIPPKINKIRITAGITIMKNLFGGRPGFTNCALSTPLRCNT